VSPSDLTPGTIQGLWGTVGDCGGLWGTVGTVGDGRAVGDIRDGKYETFPSGDGGAPSPWLWVVGQVWKKRLDGTTRRRLLQPVGNHR